jgi:hypothetical protein
MLTIGPKPHLAAPPIFIGGRNAGSQVAINNGSIFNEFHVLPGEPSQNQASLVNSGPPKERPEKPLSLCRQEIASVSSQLKKLCCRVI